MNVIARIATRPENSRRMSDANLIGRIAIRSLYAEVALHPKPGLVSPLDNGSHQDMSMDTFLRSLFTLRRYFPAIAGSGASGFDTLKTLGIEAERRMLQATGGVNTHRGAIFSLGLLAAAAGYLRESCSQCRAEDVCDTVAIRWGCDILQSQAIASPSNGTEAITRHGGPGARQQAAAGFPLLKTISLSCFRRVLSCGHSREAAAVQTLFALMKELNDTTILHRAGAEGLEFARSQAAEFLDRGGINAEGWRDMADLVHRAFVQRRISPGGSADLLACTLFLHDLEHAP